MRRAAWLLATLWACAEPVPDRECFADADCADGTRCAAFGRCLPLLACRSSLASQPEQETATLASANLWAPLADGRVLRGWTQGGAAHLSCQALDRLDAPDRVAGQVGAVDTDDVAYPPQQAAVIGELTYVATLATGEAPAVVLSRVDPAGEGCAITELGRWPRGEHADFAAVVPARDGRPVLVYPALEGGLAFITEGAAEPVVIERDVEHLAAVGCDYAACDARLLIDDWTGQIIALDYDLSVPEAPLQRWARPVAEGVLVAATDADGASWAVVSPRSGTYTLLRTDAGGQWASIATHEGPMGAPAQGALAWAQALDPARRGRLAWAVVDGEGLHVRTRDGAAALGELTLAAPAEDQEPRYPALVTVSRGVLAAWVHAATAQRWVWLQCP
ncbi:MAG: hypothetical protein KC613_09790 [Myxococcales bacterium]|nr:hypothetical protein [Myxococcales bacterium]MCB9525303.1 hypothetical protein [Myxococcales bacterium]